jgi:regulator of cell morphogenesis and NO signaling
VHGERHPELLEIESLFLGSAGALTAHMKKEELVLFPYIKKMVSKGPVEKPHFGTVQNPVQMMMNEHEVEGGRFREIAELSHNYTPPEDGCNTYRVAFAVLKEYENDLHLHIHLENNILFPKAIALEKKLNNA